MSSIPALKRMKPSPDVVAAPARAALGVGVQAAEARRRRHQLAGLQEGVGAGVRADVEADDRAHARPAHVADVVAGAQGVGERARVGLLALEAQAERRQRAMRQPRLERPRDRARGDPPLAQRRGALVVGHRDGAQDEVAVAAEVLGGAHHRVVRAELERALAQRPRERVVDRHDRAARVRLGDQRAAGRARRAPGSRATRATPASRPAAPRARPSSSVGTRRTSTPLGSSTSRAMARIPG